MEYIAYCGLLCHECPLYIATKNHDEQAKSKLAVECSTDKITFTAEDMNCEGCFSAKNKDSKMCGDCRIRQCADTKVNSKNCGYCPDYPCKIIDELLPADCENRIRLNNIANKN